MVEKNLAQVDWLADSATQRVFSLLHEGGFQARVVGGAVRNTLLGLPISDIDFAGTALPEQVMALAKAVEIRCLPTGISHGTVTLMIEGMSFEITTLRRDEQTNGRHAVVAFTDDWEQDAARRDFTINALYADADGSLFDPLGGLPDLERGRIAFIGNADARVREDYLRILRFFRFYGQYGVGDIDQVGFEACIRGGAGLRQVSGERIHVELLKILVAVQAEKATHVLYQSGLLLQIVGQVPCLSRFVTMLATERALGLEQDALFRLAALYIHIPEDIKIIGRRLRLSNKEKQRLEWFSRAVDTENFVGGRLGELLYFQGVEAVRVFVLRAALNCSAPSSQHHRFRAVLARVEAWQHPVFPVSGKDLIAQGGKSGRELGETLKRLENQWVASGFTMPKERLLQMTF